jgi:flagellar hook-associated protein 3 FlgL
MRVSTVTIYNQSVSSLSQRQVDFVATGQQIAAGKRVIRPSDDPQAAAQALGVGQSKALVEQYESGRIGVRNSLSQEESVLQSTSDAIIRARTLLLQAANGSNSDSDRASIASELKGVLESVLGQANSSDGNGRYLFGGYEDGSPPFVKDASGAVVFVGESYARAQRVDAAREMTMADSGATIFLESHSRGYVAEAGVSMAGVPPVRTTVPNSGSVAFTGLDVIDTNDPGYGSTFSVSFADDGAGGINYTVSVFDAATGTSTPLPTATDVPYPLPAAPGKPGALLSFGGLSLKLEGVPQDGDTVLVGQGNEMNTNLFETFSKAIAALETPADDASSKAQLSNTLSTVLREFDNSLDNILIVGASVGARLNELDTLDLVADARTLSYSETLSGLVDLDYVKAVSEYSLRQVGLEAAQKAFTDISGMSLFRLL